MDVLCTSFSSMVSLTLLPSKLTLVLLLSISTELRMLFSLTLPGDFPTLNQLAISGNLAVSGSHLLSVTPDLSNYWYNGYHF